MAEDRNEQSGRRGEIIPGPGSDPGSGYGGAGNDNLFEAGKNDPRRRATGIPGDEDESGNDDSGSALDAGEGGFDADSPLGGERREPGR